MRPLLLLSMICLSGQIILSGCKSKMITPSIDDLIGEYDCKFEWYGAAIQSANTKKFTITKSPKYENMILINVELSGGWYESWQVGYYNSYLTMEKQEVRNEFSNTVGKISILKDGWGKALQDSIYFEGQQYIEPNIMFGATYCKYWAKKK